MFRNVLIGYEGSDRSEDALALAFALAEPGASVTAACSYWWEPLSARAGTTRPGEATLRAGAQATLALLPYRGASVIRTVAAPGTSPAQALCELAESGEHDLVVVGSTHRGTAGRVLAGTTADALVRTVSCPVAVAPLGYHERTAGALRRIGAAFDGSAPARAALVVARALAAERKAELVVLRAFSRVPVLASGDIGYGVVLDEPDLRDAAQAELDQAVSELAGPGITGELLDGDPGIALAERAAEFDLLIAGSKGHGALGRILLGSVSHELMCEPAVPVLVVPAPGRP